MKIERVLIVDDSHADQFLAEIIIKRFDANIEIAAAHNGRLALETLAEMDSSPDIIFLDINMPEMDGHEFLAEYCKNDDQTPVIVMLTSSNQVKDIEKANSYGCVKHFFTKPLDQKDMEILSGV